jgi:hypothetical protein
MATSPLDSYKWIVTSWLVLDADRRNDTQMQYNPSRPDDHLSETDRFQSQAMTREFTQPTNVCMVKIAHPKKLIPEPLPKP